MSNRSVTVGYAEVLTFLCFISTLRNFAVVPKVRSLEMRKFDTELGPIGRCYEKRTENNSKYETQISVFVVICPVGIHFLLLNFPTGQR